MSSSVVDLSQRRGELRPPPAGGLPPLRAVRLLDQLRERIRYLHYSRSTEDIYVYWCRAFIRFHGLRHPREMGGTEVEAFLTWLADERQVASATHKQALSALLFLYTKVLELNLPWINQIERPRVRRRLPVVLSREEVSAVLGAMAGELGLLARLLYGTGMRINEALQLRVKDVDFAHQAVVVRAGKGGKDRVLMLPQALAQPLSRCESKSPALAKSGRRMWPRGRQASRCHTPWNASTREPARRGPDSGCSLKTTTRPSRAAGLYVGIICTTRPSSAPSNAQSEPRRSTNRPRLTPCATVSRPTCSKRAAIFGPCRTCLATPT